MLSTVVFLCGLAACAGGQHLPHHHHHATDTARELSEARRCAYHHLASIYRKIAVHALLCSAQTPTTPPLVRSPSGVIRGSWMSSRHGRLFQAYRGIRYAEPPIGELRFQPPVQIQSYKCEVDATQDGPACPQPVFNNYPVDEDCLRLNVYTPESKSKQPLPVLVFIHAGGFYSVSGRSDLAGPHHLLDRDLVLVTINYRLASLGFLSTGDKYAPGNNGYKDQVAALRWVQRNIAAFGGDPSLVTISGYSAGSFSVMLHTISPMSKGLFHRAISMSGSPISQILIPEHQKHLAERQARLLGCPTDSSKTIIDCLKTKTSKELGDSLDNMFEFGYDPVLLWVPIEEVDFGQERFVTEQPVEALCKREAQSVPYIISQTQHEFFWKALSVIKNETLFNEMKNNWHRISPISFYLSGDTNAQADRLKQAYLGGRELANDKPTADGLGKLYSAAVIGFGVHRLANLLSVRSSQPVYYYEFAYVGNSSHYVDPDTKRPVGAVHHDDLIYLFNVSASFPSIPADGRLDAQMVDKMTAIFYNFARYGDPNPRPDTPELTGLSWPPMKPDQRSYLRIGQQFSVHQRLFEDRFQVWEELYPMDYGKCH